MRSDARKRLTENADHYLPHDSAVRDLIERERQSAAAEAWGAAHSVMCAYMRNWGMCHLDAAHGHASPYLVVPYVLTAAGEAVVAGEVGGDE